MSTLTNKSNDDVEEIQQQKIYQQSFEFWKRKNWNRDTIVNVVAEAVLGLPYVIIFGDQDYYDRLKKAD